MLINLATITIYGTRIIVIVAVLLFMLRFLYRLCEKLLDTWAARVDNNKQATQLSYQETEELAAHEGFFEESYVRSETHPNVWHTVMIPTDMAREYYREMDRIVDEQIFRNTEEI